MTRRELLDLQAWFNRRLDETLATTLKKLVAADQTKEATTSELRKSLDELEARFAEQSVPVMPTRRTPDRERPARPLPD